MEIIRFELNGKPVEARVEGFRRLLDVLREDLGLTGTKEGCGQGECGACTVLVDGNPVNSCLFPAAEVDGRRVTTIEGLAGEPAKLSVLQQAFVEQGGIQCGFCTPGMILAARALLDRNPHPGEAEIREALSGNLCRCTGYHQIVRAVSAAAEKESGGGR
jgi:carbon-monoxide dehydrogenase small subunit